jgi:molecular chaperone DnaK
MSKIVGIDLGTTNSLVAAVEAGIPYVIADAGGARLTPSVVHFPGPDQAPVVGRKAARIRALKPRETVYSIKRFMGRRRTRFPARGAARSAWKSTAGNGRPRKSPPKS